MTPTERAAATGRIAAAAVGSERTSGVPAELTAAQAILESGWLQHAPGNNAFGIKAHDESGRQRLATKEWFTDTERSRFLSGESGRTAVLALPEQRSGSRRLFSVQDWFAAYESLELGFADHARVLKTVKVYAPAWLQYAIDNNFAGLVRGIGKHYATDPQYAETVLIIARGGALVAAINAARAIKVGA